MLDRKYVLFLICVVVASTGFSCAFQQSWTSNTGQPQKMVGDGQNILVTTASAVKEIDPTGAQVWSQNLAVSNGGKAIKPGKYVFIGTGNDAKALSKTDGSVKWTKTNILGESQTVKYIFVKGNMVIFSNDAKAIVVDRDTGNNLTTVEDAPTTCEPSVFGGYYLAGTSSGVTTYKGFMSPDLRVKSVKVEGNKTTATVENIGLSNANKVLVKFVVMRTDGTYRTIHINAGTIGPEQSKDVVINGAFSKGYAIVDPYYGIPELNEGNNQRYFTKTSSSGSTTPNNPVTPSNPGNSTNSTGGSSTPAMTTTAFNDSFTGTSIDSSKWTVPSNPDYITAQFNDYFRITSTLQMSWIFCNSDYSGLRQYKANVTLPANFEVDSQQVMHGGASNELALAGIGVGDQALHTSESCERVLAGHISDGVPRAVVVSNQPFTNVETGWSSESAGSGYCIGIPVSDMDTKNYRIIVTGLNVSVYDGSTHIADTTLPRAPQYVTISAMHHPDGPFFTYYQFNNVKVLT